MGVPTKEEAEKYIATHDLHTHLQSALNTVLMSRPDDPLYALSEYLLNAPMAVHRWDMSVLFGNFDVDGDGKLTISEFARAFRAFGLKKRDGSQLEMDIAMFKSFDSNGDGFVDLKELEAGLKPKTRRKIEQKCDAGWKFDRPTWEASVARHARWDMAKVFKQFDADGDGKLDIYELARAFRAIGLETRDGEKSDMDKAMFKSFDTSGDGLVDMVEIEQNMNPSLRKKIESKLEAGWKFDQPTWDASVARHKKYDMKQIFAQFDADGDGKLDLYEISRAFRALGLPKRDGTKMDMDHAMFKSFDVNGDGYVSMEELDEGLKPKTRRKIELKLEAGWTFDPAKWAESVERHKDDA
jgi:calcium-binding protein CML